MSVEIKGMDEVLNKLSEKLSDRALSRAENAALKPAGELVEKEVKGAVSAFADTGAETDEVVVGKAHKVAGENIIRVGWNGPKNRYAIVHLNEFGYTRGGKHFTPRGFGVLQKTYDAVKPQYKLIVMDGLRSKLL